MSFEETEELDLCEYDSLNEKTFQATSSSLTEHGIPLSVELSESLCASQVQTDEPTSNLFIEAPQIFLRLESTNTSVTDLIPQVSAQSSNINVSNDIETISFDCKENKDVNICDDCVELQYENEFESLDECNAEIIHKGNNLDNDYEELLLEGIS